VQTALVSALLDAPRAALWLGKGTLEFAWSLGLSPQGIPPNRLQEFLKKCPARAVERKAAFLATNTIGSEGFAFQFVLIGSPLRGIAVFSGPKNLWDCFQSARATVLAAVGMLSENGAQGVNLRVKKVLL